MLCVVFQSIFEAHGGGHLHARGETKLSHSDRLEKIIYLSMACVPRYSNVMMTLFQPRMIKCLSFHERSFLSSNIIHGI